MLCFLRHYLTVSFIALSMSLTASVDYQIIPLLPSSFDRHKNPDAESSTHFINNSGYVIGQLEVDPNERIWRLYPAKGFVYHPDFGFKVITGTNENAYTHITHMDDLGICYGFEKNVITNDNGNHQINVSAFTFDSRTDQFCEIEIQYPNSSAILSAHMLGADQFLLLKKDSWDEYFSTAIFDNQIGRVIHSLSTLSYTGLNKNTCTFGSSIYSPERGLENLGSLDTYSRWPVKTVAINNNNTVAGIGKDTDNISRGFIWSRENGFTLIPHLGGESISISTINDYNQVVGAIELKTTKSEQAFVYSPSQGIRNLGTLGGSNSQAYDINNHGVVVGSSTVAPDQEDERAFIWNETDGMTNLNELIPSNTEWKQLTTCWKINDNGWIIGSGIYQGCETGFLLIPNKR